MHGSASDLARIEELLAAAAGLSPDRVLAVADDLCRLPGPGHPNPALRPPADVWRVVNRLFLAVPDTETLASLVDRLARWGLHPSDLSSLVRVSPHCTIELLDGFPAYVAAHWCLRWIHADADGLEPVLGRGGARLLIAAASPRTALASLLCVEPAVDSLGCFVERALLLRGGLPDGWAVLLAASEPGDDPVVVLAAMRADPALVTPAAAVLSATGVGPLEALDVVRACIS